MRAGHTPMEVSYSVKLSIASLALPLVAAAALTGSAAASQRGPVRHAAAGTVTEYAIPTAKSGPVGIVTNIDGALWFCEANASKLGRLTTTGSFSEIATPTANASPQLLTVTDDPNFPVWFTENALGSLGIVTYSGSILELPVTKPQGARPYGIAPGPPGNEAIWYTNFQAGNGIGRINSIGKFREYSLGSANAEPAVIVAGPDNALWFTEFANARIGRISTKGAISEYVIPDSSKSNPYGIALGPDNALWFTLSGTNKIGQITTKGRIKLFTIPTAKSSPMGIAAGPDSALWFTESRANNIGRIDPATGNITEYPIPTKSSCPDGITLGPDGAMWFTENCGNNIGRITTS